MNNRNIIEAGGTLERQKDSRWVVTGWHIPGGYDYTNAQVVKGFFTEAQTEVAKSLSSKYSMPPEMADLSDLSDPGCRIYQERNQS